MPASSKRRRQDRESNHGHAHVEHETLRLRLYLRPSFPAWALPLLLLLAVGACEPAAEPEPATLVPAVAFDTIAVEIQAGSDTFRLNAELAETDAQRSYGLKQRPALPEDHGMLFVYTQPQDATAGFWMYRTLIPLDIAYLDAEGRIVAIRSMTPCESPYPRVCRTYPPGVPYSGAFEVNRGYFDRRGIEIGDRVVRVDSVRT